MINFPDFNMIAIKITNLDKSYGKIAALQNINLAVPQGAIYGLVGSNGAGKTTLIKSLVGITQPSSGQIFVMGHDPTTDKRKLRKKLGYMPQDTALYETLSVSSNIKFIAKTQSVKALDKNIRHVLSITELSDRAHDPVHTLSGGMKKRVSLACALVHQPEILFLDEPTAAVDPQLRARLWGLFQELAADGTTVVISTHLMDEALLCDKITILNKGKVVLVDSPLNIKRQGTTSISVNTSDQEYLEIINSTPEAIAEHLHKFGLQNNVSSIGIDSSTLEEIVLSIVGENPVET